MQFTIVREFSCLQVNNFCISFGQIDYFFLSDELSGPPISLFGTKLWANDIWPLWSSVCVVSLLRLLLCACPLLRQSTRWDRGSAWRGNLHWKYHLRCRSLSRRLLVAIADTMAKSITCTLIIIVTIISIGCLSAVVYLFILVNLFCEIFINVFLFSHFYCMIIYDSSILSIKTFSSPIAVLTARLNPIDDGVFPRIWHFLASSWFAHIYSFCTTLCCVDCFNRHVLLVHKSLCVVAWRLGWQNFHLLLAWLIQHMFICHSLATFPARQKSVLKWPHGLGASS